MGGSAADTSTRKVMGGLEASRVHVAMAMFQERGGGERREENESLKYPKLWMNSYLVM